MSRLRSRLKDGGGRFTSSSLAPGKRDAALAGARLASVVYELVGGGFESTRSGADGLWNGAARGPVDCDTFTDDAGSGTLNAFDGHWSGVMPRAAVATRTKPDDEYDAAEVESDGGGEEEAGGRGGGGG